jgi:methionyl-tRNA formyltransferase
MNYIIACNRPWCSEMSARLEEQTGGGFHFIGEKENLTLDVCEEYKPTFLFFPHWSDIIPEVIHSSFECVVFHMTDLPYGRGGSPLQNLILTGHKETKLSALRCVAELDAGPIYLKEPLSLLGSAEEIYIRANRLIEKMILQIIRERPEPQIQQGTITTFKRRNPKQGDWSNAVSLDEVFEQIRMLDAEGYPPAFVQVGPYKLEFTRASQKTNYVIADVKISKVD